MFSKFMNLDKEKQDRILNAAMKEFALKGYDNASTNEIVKEAEISKGLLFHYFQNKKQLFLFLYDHTIEVLMEKIMERINWDEKDIFVRYRQISMLKIEIYQVYPEMFNFVKSIYKDTSPAVKMDIDRKAKELLESSMTKLFSDIDLSKFKKGIDVKKAINIINWTVEGFAFQMQEKALSLAWEDIDNMEIMAEMEEYLDILRSSLYE
ncbi:TetR/AcrR family transcriptional regulator [Peribacillus alkalitolerans]|uniref:TetR/AcrR family transcriptional regulator n=1 Tax=Peribacillus alkalitolerans TaxID=1550385 RepID=UPI0013D67BA2|nr:helix-turn-helix domain-containing protein [Peribacillus alkalitolerans]